MRPRPPILRSLVTVAVVAVALLRARAAAAQKACDFLLPPSGGSFEIAIHRAYLTAIQFPEKLGSAKTSDLSDYDIRPDGDRGLLIRPKLDQAAPANINLTTGAVRVSVNLRTVDTPQDACAIVTFKPTTEEEARQRAIDEAVTARTAALAAQVAALRADQARQIRAQLDAAILTRAAARLDVVGLNAVARNDAGLIAWVLRAVYLGDDVLVNVELENHSGATVQVRAIELRQDGRDRAAAVDFVGGARPLLDGGKLRAVVFVPAAATLRPAATLVVRTASGASITVADLGLP
ncbi:MAG: hypothetical protein R3B06_21260 [Kofleriaceae bacterium]